VQKPAMQITQLAFFNRLACHMEKGRVLKQQMGYKKTQDHVASIFYWE